MIKCGLAVGELNHYDFALRRKIQRRWKEFAAKKLMQEQKPSIRKALAAFRDKAKQLNADRQKVRKHIWADYIHIGI